MPLPEGSGKLQDAEYCFSAVFWSGGPGTCDRRSQIHILMNEWVWAPSLTLESFKESYTSLKRILCARDRKNLNCLLMISIVYIKEEAEGEGESNSPYRSFNQSMSWFDLFPNTWLISLSPKPRDEAGDRFVDGQTIPVPLGPKPSPKLFLPGRAQWQCIDWSMSSQVQGHLHHCSASGRPQASYKKRKEKKRKKKTQSGVRVRKCLF